jgi:2-polyprenyl-3-methyl-5-hydroxy-6-metoxy-1,4-benzoquinol methylase
MRARLAYLHLPKAAGTSIRASLAQHFDDDETVPFSFDRYLFGNFDAHDELQYRVFLGDPAELAGYRYMEGHWTLPTVLGGFAPDDVACVLREPRSRFLSHYTFWRSWPESSHELWEPYRIARLAGQPLSAYATDDRVAHQSDNLATRLILGPHPLVPVGGFIADAHGDALAEEACAQLDELGFVDVLERGDEVYAAFEQWCGESLARTRLNETDQAGGEPVDVDDLVDPATARLVEARNRIDLVIWHHVAQRRGLDERTARSLADSTCEATRERVITANSAVGRYRVPVDVDAPNNAHAIAIEMVGSGQRVLEVGCGPGHVTEHLAAAGNEVVGVELVVEAADAARVHADRVHRLDLETTSVATFERGPFDVIVLGDVLEHLRDPRPILADLVGLLGPDGRLVVSVPHVGHADVRLMLLQGRWEYQPDGILDATHLRWFTRSSLRELLASVGFRAVRVERVTLPTGGTVLPIGDPDPDVVRYIEADPDAHTRQFVVEAHREGVDASADALADAPEIIWPSLAAERGALERRIADLDEHNRALQNEVTAWRTSRIVRLSQPLRSLVRRLRRAP